MNTAGYCWILEREETADVTGDVRLQLTNAGSTVNRRSHSNAVANDVMWALSLSRWIASAAVSSLMISFKASSVMMWHPALKQPAPTVQTAESSHREEASDGLEDEATSLLSAVISCTLDWQCQERVNAREGDEACDSTAVLESADETHLFRQGKSTRSRPTDPSSSTGSPKLMEIAVVEA